MSLIGSLTRVVDYNWADEAHDFEVEGLEEGDENHIFTHLKFLRDWLKDPKLTILGGDHAGTDVSLWSSEEDGVPVVQIDTPDDNERTPDLVRVWINDAQVHP